MRIIIDIGHPAHVHYFRNFIKIMELKGHTILITTRDKEVTLDLLKKYSLKYKCTGRNLKSVLGKFWSIIRNDYKLFFIAIKFKPDVFLSANLPFPAHIGAILKKPVIGLSDTEHAWLNNLLTNIFDTFILTPVSYKKNLGQKQIRFRGYLDLCYLHPNHFKPDISILKLLGLQKEEKYIILRFVSWGGSHDYGHSGMNIEMKRQAISRLSKYAKVFISSESNLPEDLEKYKINIPPDKMHDALFYSTLFVGESGTMASEASVLGVISINISTSAPLIGVFSSIAKYGLMYVEPSPMRALEIAENLLKDDQIKEKSIVNRKKLLEDNIDVTNFLVSFFEDRFINKILTK
jgi:uncharacterized protein